MPQTMPWSAVGLCSAKQTGKGGLNGVEKATASGFCVFHFGFWGHRKLNGQRDGFGHRCHDRLLLGYSTLHRRYFSGCFAVGFFCCSHATILLLILLGVKLVKDLAQDVFDLFDVGLVVIFLDVVL